LTESAALIQGWRNAKNTKRSMKNIASMLIENRPAKELSDDIQQLTGLFEK
jgi:hypothetical protein